MYLTVSPSYLVLGDDNLTTIRVIRSRDGVVEETNSADDLALFNDADLSAISYLTSAEVGGIADDLLGRNGFLSRTDADKIAITVSDDLVNWFVEHVGTTIDGGETGEGLRKLPETIERVNVGGFAVASHGRGVHNDTVVSRSGRFSYITARDVRGRDERQSW